MIYGSMAVALLWLLFLGPLGRLVSFQFPPLIPALGFAALMTWLQATCWLPSCPSRWLRYPLALVFIVVLGASAEFLVIDGRMSVFWDCGVAAQATAVVAAFVTALVGVARDRRGDLWSFRIGGLRHLVEQRRRTRRRPFGSPAAAHGWYEWRCHGWLLPGFVLLIELLTTGVLVYKGLSMPNAVMFFSIWCALIPLFSAISIGTGIALASILGSQPGPRFK